MKTLLELQLEGERQLHKQPLPREPSRAQAPNHRVVSKLGPFLVDLQFWALRNPFQSSPRVTRVWGGACWFVSDFEVSLFCVVLILPLFDT